MIFATDESGGFALMRETFDFSLLTTLVCPPSRRLALAEFVEDRCRAWGLDELHGVDLDSASRREVALFLAHQEVVWNATVIDNEIFPAEEVEPWRTGQLAEMDRTWAASQSRGTTHPRYSGGIDHLRRLLDHGTSDASFVEYAIAMPRHIQDAVQAAISRYRGPAWASDWEASELLFDAKDRRGERLVSGILFPILASAEMALTLPVDYQEEGHPLRATHRSGAGGLDLVSFFGGEPTFPSSTDEPLIQLVDLIAYVAQRYLRFADDLENASTYRLLRRRQYPTGPARFRFIARGAGAKEDPPRYRHLWAPGALS
jgi:hypothetical protein